jgi:glycosyltransferase involved in cell wall biosynthesis
MDLAAFGMSSSPTMTQNDVASRRVTVLALIDWFLPGYKGGGPIRTVGNIVERVGEPIRWRVLTRDRDLGDAHSYSDVVADRWEHRSRAEVFYASERFLGFRQMRRLLRETPHDILYVNSFFSWRFGIQPLLLRWFGLIPRVPVILAPRGEFSPGALAIKEQKKRGYIILTRLIGLYRGIVWHASTEEEARHVRAWFGPRAQVDVAPNPGSIPTAELPPLRRRDGGPLRIVFLSRISRKKNLAGALRVLSGVRSQVRFDVYGPAEDQGYLRECEALLAELPPNVRVVFHGALTHDAVIPTLAGHDLFFLPTTGENFGHVVLEALLAGCPLLLSDQTPWRDLEARGVGWDLPLAEAARFQEVLERCATMSADEHARLARAARAEGLRYLRSVDGVLRTATMFIETAAAR